MFVLKIFKMKIHKIDISIYRRSANIGIWNTVVS